jgi:Ni/Co efflux regulator RcnB
MRKLLISAAALALLAVPALAQPEPPGSRGKAMMGHQQPTPAPQAAAPPNRGGGDRGARGGDRGTRGPQAPAAQPAAPVAQPQTGNRFDGNRDGRGDNAGRYDRNDNRGGWRGNDNRPGFNNRQGNNSFGNRPGYGGQRNDYSNFRDYHRGFNAERRFRAPAYRRPQGWYSRRWSFGEILPSLFWGQQYWLSDFRDYDLPPPPPGTVWVRYGSDAMLIDRYSGEIITVQYGVFY